MGRVDAKGSTGDGPTSLVEDWSLRMEEQRARRHEGEQQQLRLLLEHVRVSSANRGSLPVHNRRTTQILHWLCFCPLDNADTHTFRHGL